MTREPPLYFAMVMGMPTRETSVTVTWNSS